MLTTRAKSWVCDRGCDLVHKWRVWFYTGVKTEFMG